VQRNIDTAKLVFTTKLKSTYYITMCDSIVGDLYLREGNILAARSLFEKCIKLFPRQPEINSFCLERLANVSRWDALNCMPSWTTVFLMHSLKFKERLAICKALLFMGDIFLAQGDESTATSLFTVALDGFTHMDVHFSRAECMRRLGDIFEGHGDKFKAVELWEAARPLFERSSQTKQVEQIDQRLAGVGEDVLEQHRNNLARLTELNALTGIVEDDPSDIEDLEDDLDAVKFT